MPLVARVTSVEGAEFSTPFDEVLAISAVGEVDTTGWTHVRLVPRYYATPPQNGFWEFDLVGDAPGGMVGQLKVPVSASWTYHAPKWVKGVRVYGQAGSVDLDLSLKHNPIVIGPAPQFSAMMLAQQAGHVIVRRELGVFDDSIQPTGTIHWSGLVPHAEMKKLRHTLTLTAEGPDEAKINDCLNKAAAAGLIAAITAAFVTGGAALPAAVSAFLSELLNCLGGSFTARVDDESHWIYWDT